MDLLAVHADATTGGHDDVAIMEGIADVRQAAIRMRRCDIDIGGTLHAQGFMRSFAIEFVNEVIELFLLLQRIHRWRAGSLLLECEVRSLMAAVLLRMSRLDALDLNAEPEPPHRQLRQIEQSVRAGERYAVVRADRERKSALCKQSFEGRRSVGLNPRLFASIADFVGSDPPIALPVWSSM